MTGIRTVEVEPAWPRTRGVRFRAAMPSVPARTPSPPGPPSFGPKQESSVTAANEGTSRGTNAAGLEFTFTRDLDAPRELVWRAFTEPEHLRHWWGPKGFTMHSCTLDLRPGGVFHYLLRSPDGQEIWGKFVYREIIAPERLVAVVTFSDEHGNLTRHPWDPGWPVETLSAITFAEHNGRTRLTVRWVPHNATEAERGTFAAGHDSMRQGWTGTADQLAGYLAKARGEA